MTVHDPVAPRIAIATGRYFRAGETFVNRHISELFAGNTVVICGRRQGENPYDKPVFSRLQSAMNPADLLTGPYHLLRSQQRYGTPLVPFGRAKARLMAFLRAQKADVILSEFGSQAVLLWPVAHEMGLPLFTYFRGRDASKYLANPRRVAAYRKMMPQLAGVFAVSGFLLDNLAAHGLRHDNAHVVPSGVDCDLFQPAAKRQGQMLAVGRFVEKKAPLLTLEAFITLAGKYPHARLDFIGHGPLAAACKARAAASGLADRVTFHDQKPHDVVRRHLAEADIFVQHSVTGTDGETEGMPTAIQEAMACGAAILSTRHAGIPDVVRHGHTGLLSDEFDLPAFTAGMDRLLQDPAHTRAMGEAARSYAVSHFDYRSLYARVEDVIAQSLQPQPLRVPS